MSDEPKSQGLEDSAQKAKEATKEEVAGLRGLPESASNDNPLPIEAVDTMVNKAEGDHEALDENAYQEKTVRESDEVEFNGLTSVEEAALKDQRHDLEEAGATVPSASSSANATDSAKALAEEHGVDLSTVEGSGADGRITKADVEAKVSA